MSANNYQQEGGLTRLLIYPHTVLLNSEDIEKAKQYHWMVRPLGRKKEHFYAVANIGKGKQILLHRLILNAAKGQYIDHVNHDTLDNRKQNIRLCTQSENMRNSQRDTPSGVQGVYWHKINKKWIARIFINNTSIFLGSYVTKDEAIKKRKQAEVDYYGEFRFKEEEIVCVQVK